MKFSEKFKKLCSGFQPINFIVLLLAGIINAFGVNLFLAPLSLYDSGFSGTAMLLAQLTPQPWSLGVFLLLLNIPFFVYGYHKQGTLFTVYSLFAVLVYAFASLFINYCIPAQYVSASPFAGQDLLLAAIFGGIISGVGSGLTIRFGGAIDGVEVMAVIFSKKLGLTVGNFVMVYNVLLYIAAGCLMRSFILPLYSILTYAAAIKSIDFIVEGFDKAKSAMIITTKEAEISEALSEAFGHGITHINARGYYKNGEKTIIYFVINRFQIAKMQSIIAKIDKTAFVTISEVSEVMGRSLKERSQANASAVRK